MDGALDGMMGMVPMVIAGGVVMKMTDSMMGPNSSMGRRNNRSMEGQQERYEPKERKAMRTGMNYGHKKARRRSNRGATNPQGLSSMMKNEGRQVMKSVAYEGHKLGKGTLGSLPGVGKVTVGKISDIGLKGNRMSDAARGSMKARTLGKL